MVWGDKIQAGTDYLLFGMRYGSFGMGYEVDAALSLVVEFWLGSLLPGILF